MQQAFVEGPEKDSWGTWVSALIPLNDPVTGKTLAVLGVDINAENWRWQVFSKSIIPIAFIIVLLIMISAIFFSQQSSKKQKETSINTRLMIPVGAMLFIVFLVVGILFIRQEQQIQKNSNRETLFLLRDDFIHIMKEQYMKMEAIGAVLTSSEEVRQAFKEENQTQLETLYRPYFEVLHNEHNIKYLTVLNKQLEILYNFHQRSQTSRTSQSLLVKQAQEQGSVISGLSVGESSNSLRLQAVVPVEQEQQTFGYLMISKDITDLLQVVEKRNNLEILFTLRKDLLDKSQWEKDNEFIDSSITWQTLENEALSYSSLVDIKPSLLEEVASSAIVYGPSSALETITDESSSWVSLAIPLYTAQDKAIGTVYLLMNNTASMDFSRQLYLSGIVIALIILFAMLGFMYVLFKRTDLLIQKKQKSLTREQRAAYCDPLFYWRWSNRNRYTRKCNKPE